MSVELLDWFDCDWLSRLVATVTQSKGQGATAWTTVETRHFWYDGWNLMAETVAKSAEGKYADPDGTIWTR